MAISRTLVIVILSFLGFLIILLIVLYFYRIPIKYVPFFNISKNLQAITSQILLLNIRRKKADSIFFLISLILAILVIITMAILYYNIYRQSISLDIENRTEKIIEEYR